MIPFQSPHWHRTHVIHGVTLWTYTTREIILIFERYVDHHNSTNKQVREWLFRELKLRKEVLDLTYLWA